MFTTNLKSSSSYQASKSTTPSSPQIGNLQLVKTVSQEHSCTTYLGKDIVTQREYAVKIFNPDGLHPSINTLEQEATIHKALSNEHPNLLNLYGYFPVGEYSGNNGSDKQAFAFVLELEQDRNLFQCIQTFGSLSEEIARTYFAHLLSGIEHVHNNGFVHLDLTLENLIFSKDFSLKITNFSCAAITNSPMTKELKSRKSTSYTAPELISSNQPSVNCASDLFSCGVILFTMVAGYPPFNYASSSDLHYNLIVKRQYSTFWKQHERHGRTYSESFKELINGLLANEVTERLTISEVKAQAWFLEPKLTVSEIKEKFEKVGGDQLIKKAEQASFEQKFKESKAAFASNVKTQGHFAMNGIRVKRN